MSVEAFSKELLAATSGSIEEGFAVLDAASKSSKEALEPPLAQDLSASYPAGSSDYLLGRAPEWGDVRDGFSAVRQADSDLEALAKEELQVVDPIARGTVLVTGTAGSGKSTAVMRLALSLSAAGMKVAWVDNSVDISPRNLLRWMESPDEAPVLIIEDIDRYGPRAPLLIKDISKSPQRPLIIVSIRSGRGADQFADQMSQLGGSLREFTMPDLTDEDILALIRLLETNHRLGALQGRDRGAQIQAFRVAARRQILVAMLEATSGDRFENIIESEMYELGEDTRNLYALTAVASALRFGMTRDELLLAIDDRSNATLASIDALQRRRLMISDLNGVLRVRHKVIAEVLMRALARDGQLGDIVRALAVTAASKVPPRTRRGHAAYRRLRALMNHDWLTQYVGIPSTRSVYEALEDFVQWDYHYWLQRGSFELEHGEFQYAENFLNGAYGLSPDDPLVKTEFAYMLLKRAVMSHIPGEAREEWQEGASLLREAIASRGGSDPHQYHIYGKQGLHWLMRGDVTPGERRNLLDEIEAVVLEGSRAHPRDERLQQLLVEVRNAKLGHVASFSRMSPSE